MSLSANEMSPADIRACTANNTANGYGSGMGFGGDGAWWIIILFLFAFLGWGNGFGGFGGGSGGQGGYDTRADIQRGFDNSAVITKLDGINHGICDSTYALNNTITNGFANAELSRCNQQAAFMQQLNNMAMQSQQCCCETQRQIERGFCDTNYNLATNANSIIQNAHSDTDRVLARLDAMENARQQERIAALQAENQTLRFQASQTTQNGFIDAVGNSIVARLQQPSPIPAYMVPNPNCCYNACSNCA